MNKQDKAAVIAFIRGSKLYKLEIAHHGDYKQAYLHSSVPQRKFWACGPRFATEYSDFDITYDDSVVEHIVTSLGLRQT
jgi:hypothetical protein